MQQIYNKEVFKFMIRKYRLIIADKEEEIKSYKLQLADIKERINNILMYKTIDRASLEEVQELLEFYTWQV